MHLLFLLLAIFSATGSGTVFEARGHVKCVLETRWFFHVGLYEIDNLSSTRDALDTFGYVNLKKAEVWNYHLKGEQSWDGPYNNYWEVAIRIKHNCTTFGDIRELWWEEPLHNITEEHIFIHWERDVTNRGEVTTIDLL